MDEKALNVFLKKFMENQVSAKEHQEFVDWLTFLPEDQAAEVLAHCSSFFEQHPGSDIPQYHRLVDRIEEQLDQAEQQEITVKKRGGWVSQMSYAAAAAVVLICGVLYLYFYTGKPVHVNRQIASAKSWKIVPGGNKAILTLADGKQIILSDVANGTLMQKSDVSIAKVKEGELVYREQRNPHTNNTEQHTNNPALQYNTLVTPRGGQYKVTLPDGSRVWLNAATTLRFPNVFKGAERRIELSGEAYFEVAKNKAMPFVVNVNHSEVKVLGTHFNIMGYADESATHTTLLEGAVRIIMGSESKDIVPGEQAIVQQQIKIRSVDTSEVVGWKNGNFTFSHERISEVMKKIARWYDVDIQYQGKVTQEEFVGVIPRSKELTDVLHKLELTGLLKFKLKERSVIVMN
jgi:transmembrane sensor